jgi:hypothetical protein
MVLSCYVSPEEYKWMLLCKQALVLIPTNFVSYAFVSWT